MFPLLVVAGVGQAGLRRCLTAGMGYFCSRFKGFGKCLRWGWY